MPRPDPHGHLHVPQGLPRDPTETYDPDRVLMAGHSATTLQPEDDSCVGPAGGEEDDDDSRRASASAEAAGAPSAPSPAPAPTAAPAAPPPLGPVLFHHFAAAAADRAPTDTVPDPASGRSSSGHAVPPAERGFDLDRVIARGGVGEIWDATQVSLGRRIAVKRLREDIYADRTERPSEMRAFEEAFRHEALTTGYLEHPNIVPVYDFGYDEHRRPLLAMKLVNGRAWSQMLREDFPRLKPVDLLARHLPILLDVAQAVAFSHARGIIHRDIKPGQVMVGEFGEVLLMDWGLAVRYRDLRPEDSAELPRAPSLVHVPSTMTASNPSGTPAYMAPEQTERSARHLGPWTDVFLLGGTLYHLLTGTPPHQSATSISAFTRARSCEVEPPELRAPHRDIPPDLSALCQRAMDPDRERRLGSVREFIAGIEDYLSGANRRREAERILALVRRRLVAAHGNYNRLSRLNEMIERARALWPENPEAGALMTRLLSITAEAALENRDLVLARVVVERMPAGPERSDLARRVEDLEDEARGNEERLFEVHRLVQKQRDRAEDLLNFLLVDLHQELKPLGRLDMLEKIALKAIDYYAGIEDPAETIDTMRRHGLALRLAGDVLRDQGKIDEALATFRSLEALAREVIARDPDHIVGDQLLAEAHRRVADLLYEQRDVDGAFAAFSRALTIRERLAERQPGDLVALNELAWIHEGLGVVERRRGRNEASLAAHRRAIVLREQVLAADPDNPTWLYDLSWSLNSEAVVLAVMRRHDEAMATYRRAVELRVRLVALDPANATYQRSLSFTVGSLARLLQDMKRLDEARVEYGAAIDILRVQARQDPTNDRLARNLAWTIGSQGMVLEALGRLDEARDHLVECGALQERVMAKDPSFHAVRHEFAWSVFVLGCVHAELGNTAEALRCINRSLAIREEWSRLSADSPRTRRDIARNHAAIAWVHRLDGRDESAASSLRRAREALGTPTGSEESGSAELDAHALEAILLHLEGHEEMARRIADHTGELGIPEPPFRAIFGR